MSSETAQNVEREARERRTLAPRVRDQPLPAVRPTSDALGGETDVTQ